MNLNNKLTIVILTFVSLAKILSVYASPAKGFAKSVQQHSVLRASPPASSRKLMRFTYSNVGDRKMNIPEGWMVKRIDAQVRTFRIFDPNSNNGAFIEYAYKVWVNVPLCRIVNKRFRKIKITRILWKAEYQNACASEFEFKDKTGKLYRAFSFAGSGNGVPGMIDGFEQFYLFAAPGSVYESMQGAKIAVIGLHMNIASREVDAAGNISKKASGGFYRRRHGTIPGLRGVTGWANVPQGWTLHARRLGYSYTSSPNIKSHASPVYMQSIVPKTQVKGLDSSMLRGPYVAELMLKRGFSRIKIADQAFIRNAKGRAYGISVTGDAMRGSTRVAFNASYYPRTRKLYLLAAPEKTLEEIGGSALFVSLIQGDPYVFRGVNKPGFRSAKSIVNMIRRSSSRYHARKQREATHDLYRAKSRLDSVPKLF